MNEAQSSSAPKDFNLQDDLILLSGAGASHHLGLATLDSLLRETAISTSRQEINQIIWDLRRSIEASKKDHAIFEELISQLKFYIQVAEVLQTDHNFRSRLGMLPHEANTGVFKGVWQEALSECYRVLLAEYGPNNIESQSENFHVTVELLHELARLNSGRLHIYTTNYDCTYQVMASHTSNLSFQTHISNVDGIFYEQWHCARPELDGANLPRISVHRLHGCVAWFTYESPYRIKEIFGAGDHLTIEDEGLLHKMCIKLVTSQEIGTNVAFMSAFQEFYEHLRTAKVLLAWGFSFRDLEVLRAINNSFFLRHEPIQIFYIDPFKTENQLIDNIQTKLSTVPVRIASEFRPKPIPWYPQHGGEKLIKSTIETLARGGS